MRMPAVFTHARTWYDAALPFLQYTEVFLLPCGIYAVLYVVSLFFVNVSALVLKAYLGG